MNEFFKVLCTTANLAKSVIVEYRPIESSRLSFVKTSIFTKRSTLILAFGGEAAVPDTDVAVIVRPTLSPLATVHWQGQWYKEIKPKGTSINEIEILLNRKPVAAPNTESRSSNGELLEIISDMLMS